MSNYITDPWKIIEEGFNPMSNRVSESLFSIGNGFMGQRANFEETFSGDSLEGSYIAGVYYPDKTKVGWWKNGYPEYFAKVLNSVNWIGFEIKCGTEFLDLAKWEIMKFSRILDMKEGTLSRSFIVRSPKDTIVKVEAKRFISMKRKDIGAISYSITPVSSDINISLSSYLEGNVTNEDSNYNEFFWEAVSNSSEDGYLSLEMETKKTKFRVNTTSKTLFNFDSGPEESYNKSGYCEAKYTFSAKMGKEYKIYKISSILSSFTTPVSDLGKRGRDSLNSAIECGFDGLLSEHSDAWEKIWESSDIEIKTSDSKAQQGIRYNIFQLNQTYTGEDSRLNIGPKGFTGEKYGGTTYWDTEAYCLPFYLGTRENQVSKQLLKYRYNQLDKAIENAEKLGITGGAALYPMVTINGEECHNEWEITFEEIHRNGAIAYAIYNYINITGDKSYLFEGGMEVLLAISRYWSKRVNFSKNRNKYVILGVTGPNEYENNVNNNWYTNRIAIWTIDYTLDLLEEISKENPGFFKEFTDKNRLTIGEVEKLKEIKTNIYLPEEDGIYLQQDGFLDKELNPVSSLGINDTPLNQNWSWDRILRSCYIKQADVLQGLFFFEESYSKEVIEKNFDFYEPLTVHESSLSPCIHSIIASKLGKYEKAYEHYLRTARLDLDNINNDTDDGLHITSMAGTWMSCTYGFAGLRYKDGKCKLSPYLPKGWEEYSFHLNHNGNNLKIRIKLDKVIIETKGETQVIVYDSLYTFTDRVEIPLLV